MPETSTTLHGNLNDLKLANSERTIFWEFNVRNLVEDASDCENPASMKLAKQVIDKLRQRRSTGTVRPTPTHHPRGLAVLRLNRRDQHRHRRANHRAHRPNNREPLRPQ